MDAAGRGTDRYVFLTVRDGESLEELKEDLTSLEAVLQELRHAMGIQTAKNLNCVTALSMRRGFDQEP